jgi:hypothetical protein
MAELTLEALRGELGPIRAELAAIKTVLAPMRAHQQELRQLKAAVNDFAATNVTTGEITALHEDVNRALAANAELEARIVTLERLVRELQER